MQPAGGTQGVSPAGVFCFSEKLDHEALHFRRRVAIHARSSRPNAYQIGVDSSLQRQRSVGVEEEWRREVGRGSGDDSLREHSEQVRLLNDRKDVWEF